ncbi:uncharacterized protein LOC132309158 [Cornus florida]|uniref:uncharacterized protein LOC132309158 n=1 Tax=Cornus florida TaxID=4283 RepID=UPI0028A0B801|nr:uncharacterized protein LOC132309158 [Cornus florida]
MNTSTLKSHLIYFPRHSNPTSPPAKLLSLITPIKITSCLKHPTNPLRTTTTTTTLSRQTIGYPTKTSHINKPSTSNLIPAKSERPSKEEFPQVLPNGYSRVVIFGAVSVGFVLFLMGLDDHKALAFGPGGPLMEDFWENMRRYALYALTVSTGVAYVVFQPIVELLKNPISAILIITIIGGGFYIVSQVVSAMVGVTDFSYDYSY